MTTTTIIEKNRIPGVLLVLCGAILFSTKAIMVKLAYRYEGVNAVNLLLLRMLFALPFYLVILAINKNKTNPPRLSFKAYGEIILYGILGYYLASYFDFKGLQYISAGLERIILFIYPTIVVIINRMFFGKAITSRQILAIVICYLGVVISYLFEGKVATTENIGLGSFLILLSAITYASYLVGSGKLVPKLGTLRFTSLAMIISSICVILHCYVDQNIFFPILDTEVYWYGFAMAVFATVIPSFMISEGINRLGSSDASIIGSVGPISTIILAAIFLGEEIGWVQILGTLLVIAGVFLVSGNKS